MEMNPSQSKAWDCLREDERQSLFLQLSNGKSTWESGTIMGKAHYKYIEIRERSQKFFKMFTEFFSKHEAIFRPDSPYNPKFMDYIEGCIEKRLSRKEASIYTGDSTNLITRVRTKMVEHNMLMLRDSMDKWDMDTLSLIIEFDRWNNFRILPRMFQAPSAYKRRSQEKYKIYINYLIDKFPNWAHEKLIERFKCPIRSKVNCRPRYWVTLISRYKYPQTGYYVFPTKVNDEVIREMSRFFLYVFDNQDDADTFGFMIDSFVERTGSIPSGRKFWEEFRLIIEQAVNFTQVSYIDFNRRYLDHAYSVSKKGYSKSRKDRALTKGVKRVQSDSLW